VRGLARRRRPRPLRGKRLLMDVGGSSWMWEAPNGCGRLLMDVGGSSWMWEAPNGGGRLLMDVGGS
jgi:hypothetical protein